MLFIIFLIVSIVSFFLTIFLSKEDHDVGSFISGMIATPTILITIFMIIFLFITYCDIPGVEAKWQERYSSLNARIENHLYSDEEKYSLAEEVQDWNETFAAQENHQKNIWTKIFHPESIEGLSKIDLMKIK